MVNQAFEQSYKKIRKEASIKGFRPNKAPLEMLRKMYAPHAMQQATQDLATSSYENALKDSNVRPIGDPQFNIESSAQEDAAFSFSVSCDFFPELKPIDLKTIKLGKPATKLDSKRVTDILESLKKNATEYIPISEERSTKEGDVVKIDFEGMDENKESIAGTKGADYSLELGAKHFIPGFEENLTGVPCPGEKTFDVTFPEDYNHKPLAGKKVSFKVTLKEISEKKIPELNDELAAKFGYKNFADCNEQIETLVLKQQNDEVQAQLEKSAIDAAINSTSIPLPTKTKEKTVENIKADRKKQLLSQSKTEDEINKILEDTTSNISQESEVILKTSIIVSFLSQSNGIKITAEDIEAELVSQAQQNNMPLEDLKKQYSSDQINQLAFVLTQKKVAKLIIDSCTLTEEKSN